MIADRIPLVLVIGQVDLIYKDSEVLKQICVIESIILPKFSLSFFVVKIRIDLCRFSDDRRYLKEVF